MSNEALKGAIIRQAHRKYGELIAKKLKEIRPKYQEDQRFKKATELVKEIEELKGKVRELQNELFDVVRLRDTNGDSDSIIMSLSGLRTLNVAIRGIIEDLTEIRVSSPAFGPDHFLEELENIFKEELSYIK